MEQAPDIRPDFTKVSSYAANIEKADSFDFTSAVEEFYERFPDHTGKTFFVDVSTGNIAHPDPQVVQELIDLITKSETGQRELMPVIEKCRSQKTSYCQQDGGGNSIIFIYSGDDRPRFLGPHVSPARELQFIFDHETGHAVVPEGHSKVRLEAENAADAYAVICDLQRHGAQSNLLENVMLFRASYALYNASGMINFSAPTLERMMEQRSALASFMTSDEAVSTAGKLARENTLDHKTAYALFESFEKLHTYKSLDSLTDITLTTPFPDTFKWTRTVLKAILDRKLEAPGSVSDEFRDAAARSILPKVAAREEDFRRDAKTKKPARRDAAFA